MENISLPRHVIDRLEQRWASRLQQEAKAWASKPRFVSGQLQKRHVRTVPVLVKRSKHLKAQPLKQRGSEMMLDERLARLRAHRNNIHRYRRLLQTNLTELERNYVDSRLKEEETLFKQLSAAGVPVVVLPRGSATARDSHV